MPVVCGTEAVIPRLADGTAPAKDAGPMQETTANTGLLHDAETARDDDGTTATVEDPEGQGVLGAEVRSVADVRGSKVGTARDLGTCCRRMGYTAR